MKSLATTLCLLCVLCGSVFSYSLDREAFSITNYDLKLQIDRDQHRLGVRGTITLRNDSSTPQTLAVLQISSSLNWRAIRVRDQAVQYLTQPYTSDIDHTGGLSEAIVTLPKAVAPKATIDLDIAYEGVILLDATRLTRIGTPQDVAQHADWDQIGPGFTALRGAGYVAWYPIATEAANLSEGDSLSEVLGRWKAREARSKIHLKVGLSFVGNTEPSILFNGLTCPTAAIERTGLAGLLNAECNTQGLRLDAPALVIAPYVVKESRAVEIRFLPNHDDAASRFVEAAEQTAPFISNWFGPQRERAVAADLPDSNAASFESGSLLLIPLAGTDSNSAVLAAVHQFTHAAFLSFRPWIEEGLAHFAQALYVEQQKNRQTALHYMELHQSSFIEAEKPASVPRSDDETSRSLVNTLNEELYRSKAMYVWWMLRDIIGDAALKKALASYRAEQDNDPSYMPRLIQAQTQRDLAWFFDDWVYRDRGLPDFKVESVFAEKTANTFLVTITVDNLGWAGAEVPVIVKFSGGQETHRLEVRGKSKAVIRVETSAAPDEVVVNDGSVPESDLTNNRYKIDSAGGN
jgi:hypothetical protein